jgi:hypothetical protein
MGLADVRAAAWITMDRQGYNVAPVVRTSLWEGSGAGLVQEIRRCEDTQRE